MSNKNKNEVRLSVKKSTSVAAAAEDGAYLCSVINMDDGSSLCCCILGLRETSCDLKNDFYLIKFLKNCSD